MSERLTSWAVDLTEIGAIYPFQGLEWLFAIICVGAWIGWHIWCFRWERAYHKERIAKYGDSDTLRKALEHD